MEITVEFPEPKTPVRVKFNVEAVRKRCKQPNGDPVTQGQFAALFGMSTNGYSQLKSSSGPRLETVAKIISVTGCAITDLFKIEPVSD